MSYKKLWVSLATVVLASFAVLGYFGYEIYMKNLLRWSRVIGDTIFALGIFALGWFVLGLRTGWSVSGQIDTDMPPGS